MATDPLTGARLPLDTDSPLAGSQISRAVAELSPYTHPRFDSSAERDAAYSSFVAAGGVLEDGMTCSVGKYQYARANGSWQLMWGPPGQLLTSGLTAASNWSITSQSRQNFGDGWAFVQLIARRTGSALVIPDDDGNPANVDVATAPAGWGSAMLSPLTTLGTGRVVTGYITSGAIIRLTAVGGSRDVLVGDDIEMAGYYRLANPTI